MILTERAIGSMLSPSLLCLSTLKVCADTCGLVQSSSRHRDIYTPWAARKALSQPFPARSTTTVRQAA